MQVFKNPLCNHGRERQLIAGSQRIIFEPENIEACLVTGYQLLIAIHASAAIRVLGTPGGLALVAIRRVVQRDKLIQDVPAQQADLEGEILVGAQVELANIVSKVPMLMPDVKATSFAKLIYMQGRETCPAEVPRVRPLKPSHAMPLLHQRNNASRLATVDYFQTNF